MAYKLKTLQITNFIGIPNAELEFTKPVTLICGLNRTGKSTVKDALKFAYTGKCESRNVTKFKDVTALVCDRVGGDDMQVQLNYFDDDELCIIQRGIKDASKGVEGHNPLIPYCLDPLQFIRLAPRERGSIIAGVLGAGLNKLVEEAIAQYIGDFPQQILAEMRADGVDLHNVDALRESIVGARRRYKKEVQALKLKPPRITDYDLPEDFKPEDAEARNSKLEKRMTNGGVIIGKAKTTIERKATIHDLKQQINTDTSRIKPAPELPSEVNPAEMKQAQSTLQVLKQIDCKGKPTVMCPVCNTRFSKDKIGESIRVVEKWLSRFADKLAEREQVMANNQALQGRITANTQLIETLEAKENFPLPKNSETLLADLQTERDEVQKQLVSYRRFKTDGAIYEEALEKNRELTTLVGETDRIDDALKDGGPVKADITAGGLPLPINKKLLEAWDITDLEWFDNGEITLEGRPIEQASESERYMVASVMGIALAEVGNVGFAGLDGFEILVGENFSKFMDEVVPSVKMQILIFTSTTTPAEDLHKKSVDVYHVTNGRVTHYV